MGEVAVVQGRSTTAWRALLALLALTVVLRLEGLVRPCLSDDEATYAVVADEMLAGRVLYRDVVDHKPPLIYGTYALTQAVAGRRGGMRLLHGITILVVFATALLLARIARRVRANDPPGAAAEDDTPWTAALLYVVFSATLLDYDALAANCELFMMLPLVGSVLVYLGALPQRGPVRLSAAGALIGVAALYKYQAAIQLPLLLLHLMLVWRRPNLGRLMAGWAALVGGFGAVLLAAVAVAHAWGAWPSSWFWFRFNFAYMKHGFQLAELPGRVARVAYGIGPAALLWTFGLREAWRVARSRARGPLRLELFLVGWLLVSGAAVCAGGRFFGHYFYQTTAPLAVLAAPAVARWHRLRPSAIRAALVVPAVCFVILGAAHTPLMAAAGQPDPDYPAIAAFVDAHSSPGEPLFVWGNAPVLYFEAERPLGSRFVFSNYSTGMSPATRTQTDPRVDASSNIVPESWDMLEADLTARRPALFVDTSPGNIAAYGKFPVMLYPRLQAILDRDYVPIGDVAGARVFRIHSR